jgi:hypothetical protein
MFTKEWCDFKILLNDYILQLDGAPPHFHTNVRELLNRVLQQRWIGRAANGDNHIHLLYGMNSIVVWMCVVWPRVHTLKEYVNALKTWTVAAADGVRFVRVRWEINFLLIF